MPSPKPLQRFRHDVPAPARPRTLALCPREGGVAAPPAFVRSEDRAPGARVEEPSDSAVFRRGAAGAIAEVRPQGREDEATLLYRRLRPTVMSTIGRLIGRSDPDAEDLAQQAIIAAVHGMDRYRGDAPLEAWVSGLTANIVYKHIRRRRTERRIFDSEPLPAAGVAPSSTRVGSGRATVAKALLGRVKAHLDHIDPVKAWTYLLHDVCGYDLAEVAKITEASTSAAQSRLVRGRRELHERIAADPELAGSLASLRDDG